MLEVRERIDAESGEQFYVGRYPGGGPVLRMVSLEEAIEFIQGLNASTGREVGIYAEIKNPRWHRRQGADVSQAVVTLLERYGYRNKDDKCWIQCFELSENRRLREELGYRGQLLQLVGGWPRADDGTDFHHLRTPDGLRKLAAVVDGIGPSMELVVAGSSGEEKKITSLVSDAHAAGLVVHPWTARVDQLPAWAASYGDMLQILFDQAKVDGVFTDFPGAE